MLDTGWVKFHRKMVDWRWYSDPIVRGLFMHLILTVNYDSKEWGGTNIEPGSRVTSLAKLSQETSFSEKQIRRALDCLKRTNEIEVKTNNHFSFIKLNKWKEYQIENEDEGRQKADKGQTEGRQRATIKEVKKVRSKEYNPIAADAARKISEVKILEHIDPSPKALLEDPKHHVRVIGLFALAKGVTFENREQRDSFIRRNVRTAADLKGYETDRVKQVMDWLNQNADYKWTLESVGKHIDEYGRLVKQGESLEDALKKIQQSDYGN